MVDLRSDTVTRPTPEMRRAMADADVGDDVYGEDPTVNALQEAYAERVGKAAALFVPSGVMANQIALRLLAPAGTVVVAGRRQHVVVYENGAGGRNAGIQFHAVDDTDGTVHPDEVAWVIAAAHHHHPRPGLVCLENTHMPANGTPWPIERLRETAAVATACGFPVHLDGARLFNAEVATGTSAADYAAPVTTVMSCLSKGLGAPVGSVLAGPADVIEEARAERARLGGGMRQAGVIAAAGLVALDHHGRAPGRRPPPGPDPGRGGGRAVARRRLRPGDDPHQRRHLDPSPDRPGRRPPRRRGRAGRHHRPRRAAPGHPLRRRRRRPGPGGGRHPHPPE